MKIGIDKQPASKPTRIVFLLDRSTSMNRMREEAVAGFNQYVKKQKEADGEARISLYFFDSAYKPVYENVDVKAAGEIICGMMGQQDVASNVYVPQGMTSLFDYIHDTIMNFKDTSKKYEKTILSILTDGDDTSSRRHTYSTVQAAIKEVQDAHGWEVLFLGANMNAHEFARGIGIKANNVAQFDYTKKGVLDAIDTMAFASSYYRGDAKTRGLAKSAGVGGQSLSASGAVDELNITAVYNATSNGKLDTDKKD